MSTTLKASRRPAGMTLWEKIKRDRWLFLMIAPILVYYVIFCYVPMTGIVIAFKNFKPGHGIYYGKWVGLKWFQQYFSSIYAYRTIRNTFLLSLYSIIWGFPVPIIFAVVVTEIRSTALRKVVQTVSYLPHFISTVVIVGIIQIFFTQNNGIVNNLIVKLGGQKIAFLVDPKWFRTLYVGSGVWQSFGYSSIIYIAAILGIDPALYEAARIDGITKFKCCWYVTLPMIAETIVILFILRLGSLMSIGFEKVFLMQSEATYETSDVITTYVYRKGIEGSNYSFSTAVGLFNSVINFVFVFVANAISRKVTNASLW